MIYIVFNLTLFVRKVQKLFITNPGFLIPVACIAAPGVRGPRAALSSNQH